MLIDTLQYAGRTRAISTYDSECDLSSGTEMRSKIPTQRSSIEVEASSRRFVRRSGRLKKLRAAEVVEISGISVPGGEPEVEDELHENIESSGSEKRGETEYEDEDVSSDEDLGLEENASVDDGGEISSLSSDSNASVGFISLFINLRVESPLTLFICIDRRTLRSRCKSRYTILNTVRALLQCYPRLLPAPFPKHL